MCPTVRRTAVAGSFYPADATTLRDEVSDYLSRAVPPDIGFRPRILIVPHAGYIYSGPVAASGYRLLRDGDWIERVVMVGPSHYVRFSGLALPGADQLQTPLGTVSVEPVGSALLEESPLVAESRAAHAKEHSLEVQLPFLQIVLPGVPVVPLLTGAVDPARGAAIIEPLLDDGTLLLVSSDLSHFHDDATARRLDIATADSITRLDDDALEWESACGRSGIQIALRLARRRSYRVAVVDMRNSADTAGSPERVVGYGTFALGH